MATEVGTPSESDTKTNEPTAVDKQHARKILPLLRDECRARWIDGDHCADRWDKKGLARCKSDVLELKDAIEWVKTKAGIDEKEEEYVFKRIEDVPASSQNSMGISCPWCGQWNCFEKCKDRERRDLIETIQRATKRTRWGSRYL